MGHIHFNVNFEGANGHNSIGFGAYSAVNDDGKMDFTDYGIELNEYFIRAYWVMTGHPLKRNMGQL